MKFRKLLGARRVAALVGIGALLVTSSLALNASMASADVYSSFTINVTGYSSTTGLPLSAPVAPQFYEGYASTDRVAGSETALYALQQISDDYSAAGVFGCALTGDKRSCKGATGPAPYTTGGVTPTVDVYDNYDHDEIDQGGAIGSAAGSAALCGVTPNDGLPVDLLRASASLTGLAEHGATTCTAASAGGETQDQIATSAVVGLDFANVISNAYYGSESSSPVPAGFSLTNAGGVGSTTDTAWRIFCDTTDPSLQITNWDQVGGGDEPIVLWGPANNSGTGVTFYDYAGCVAPSTGNVPSFHLITENAAPQIPAYASADCTSGTQSVIGTSAYTQSVEGCVADEVANSLFFMDYGYTFSHAQTATVTIPDYTQGDVPSWINDLQDAANGSLTLNGSPWQIKGSNTKMANTHGASVPVSGSDLTTLASERGLYLDYLADSTSSVSEVRASAAAFVNWVCDAGNVIAPKGLDPTTGVPFDTEITDAISGWGWAQNNCDAGYTPGSPPTASGPAISSALPDPSETSPT
jgi:hypothetical protein